MKKKTKQDNKIKQQRNHASIFRFKSEKGQISIEFVIIIVLLFLMFSLIVTVSVEQKKNLEFNSEKIKAKTLSEKIARNINGIYISGEGSKTTITKKYDFEIEFEENSIKVKFRHGQFISTSLLTKKINFIPKVNANKIKIENLNGVIEIEEL